MLFDVFDKVYLLLRGLVYVWGAFGVESIFYGVAAVLLVFGLLAPLLVVPPVRTWSEVCSTCGGAGVHSCPECGGSGVCVFCGGDGRIFSTPEDWWCAACQGSGRCGECGGDGVWTCETCSGLGSVEHWTYNVFGSSVILSVFDAFLFVGVFVLSYWYDEFYLGFNKWVYEVEDMDFWFNRSFSIWLFAKDRMRWAKWISGSSAFSAVFLGAFIFFLFSLGNIAGDVFAGGFLVSIFFTVIFAWLFYKYYTSGKPRVPTADYEPT